MDVRNGARAVLRLAAVFALVCATTAAIGTVAASAGTLPNDTYLDSNPRDGRWDRGAWLQSSENLQYLRTIRADRAWKRTKGEGIVVGLIDTGLDMSHPDIAANVYRNSREIAGNGIDDDHNGYVDDLHGWDFSSDSADGKPGPDNDPTDRNGHGTAVAGIVGAVQGNNEGVSGVAPGVKILPARVTNGTSSSDLDLGGAFAAANYLAANPDVDVVSVSGGVLSTDNPNEMLPHSPKAVGGVICGLVDTLTKSGKIVVAAAGNGAFNTYPARDVGSEAAGGFAPAYCSHSITSTAVTGGSFLSHLSRSPFADYGNAASIAAPGGEGSILNPGTAPPSGTEPYGYENNTILTLRAAGTDGVRKYIGDSGDPQLEQSNGRITDAVSRFVYGPDGRYVRWRGTSFTAPQVDGVIAMMLAASPRLQALPACLPSCAAPTSYPRLEKVKEILHRSARKLMRVSGVGAGLLDAGRAVAYARAFR